MRLRFALVTALVWTVAAGCASGSRLRITGATEDMDADTLAGAVAAKVTADMKTTIVADLKSEFKADLKAAVGAFVDQSENTVFNEVWPWLIVGGCITLGAIIAAVVIRGQQIKSGDKIVEGLTGLAARAECRYPQTCGISHPKEV